MQIIYLTVYSQKNYTIGVDWVSYSSHTKNEKKLENFNSAKGLQLTYRKNIDHNNFLTLKLSGVESSKNLFNLKNLRIGYEVENRDFIKNLFVTTEIVFNRLSSNSLSQSSYSIAPSLGIAYNINLNKYFQLRLSEAIEFHLPTNIGTLFSNLNFGLHYKCNKEKIVKGKAN